MLSEFVSQMTHIKAVIGVGASNCSVPRNLHKSCMHCLIVITKHLRISCVLKRKPFALFDNTSTAEICNENNSAKCHTLDAHCVVSDGRVVCNVMVVRGGVVFVELGKVCLHGV